MACREVGKVALTKELDRKALIAEAVLVAVDGDVEWYATPIPGGGFVVWSDIGGVIGSADTKEKAAELVKTTGRR